MVSAILLGIANAGAEELLIHNGPTVSTPDASLHSNIPNAGRDVKDLTFNYEFFVGTDKITKLLEVEFRSPDPLPACKAIELASKSVELAERKTPFPVKKLEMLSYSSGSKQLRYYLITLATDESAEVHRVVLMDGTVVKPRMRNITK